MYLKLLLRTADQKYAWRSWLRCAQYSIARYHQSGIMWIINREERGLRIKSDEHVLIPAFVHFPNKILCNIIGGFKKIQLLIQPVDRLVALVVEFVSKFHFFLRAIFWHIAKYAIGNCFSKINAAVFYIYCYPYAVTTTSFVE